MQNHYLKILLTAFISFYFPKANAQFVTLPDTNFINWLNANGFSFCMSGNMMDTTCYLVVNATSITCGNSNIQNLEGIQYFDNLTTLDCYDNQLTSLPSLPNSLVVLHCQNNQLTSLPSLPNSLIYLYCPTNQLNSLPLLPSSLGILYCFNNQLTSLPSLPNSLTHLYCYDNQLTSLPSLPNSLVVLHCNDNQLTSLPSLPNSLIHLYCYNNNSLNSLPSLPNSLGVLFCANNQLDSLPLLPNLLTDLSCQNNQLTSLPSLPNTLTYIHCPYNQLTSLPSLPNSLGFLHCYNNQLTSLPSLPSSLGVLRCHNNQLTSLPSLPDNVVLLDLDNNSALTCFPKYKIINTLHWSNTGITCLPNAGYIGSATPSISNLPPCQPASGCPFSWNIWGRIYEDGNGNCTGDSGEILFENIPVQLDSGGSHLQTFISNSEGYYSFETGLGNYQISIDTAGLPFDVICPAAGAYISTLTAADSLDEDLDFGLQCKPGFDVGVTSIVGDSGIFRPANFAKVKITAGSISNFFEVNCVAGISGVVEVILSGSVSYISAAMGSLVPFVSGDTLLYSIADFGTVISETDFRFIVQTDTSAILGSQICFLVNVTPITGDLNITNNSLRHCFGVINSFDPNNKKVFPEGNIDSSQHWLTYIINFQNTGTAPAQHIYILDTLDTDLDAAAFAFLSSSHDAITQILPGNILRFSFPNINLPDSVSDEPNSHGYVQYKVKLTDGLPLGTVIENTAYIFFDFNAPITTNTVVNQIQLTTGNHSFMLNKSVIQIYPNPTSGVFNISYVLPQDKSGTFEIYDVNGKKVYSQVLPQWSNLQIINLPEIANGIYNCLITSDNKRMSKKVVVIKE